MLLVPDSVLSLSVLTIGSGAVLVVESEGARALLLLEERLKSRRMECKDTTFILICREHFSLDIGFFPERLIMTAQ